MKIFMIAVALLSFGKAAEADEYCREYTKTVTVGNRPESAYGRACMQPDGDWKIVSVEPDINDQAPVYAQQDEVSFPQIYKEPEQIYIEEPVYQPVYGYYTEYYAVPERRWHGYNNYGHHGWRY